MRRTTKHRRAAYTLIELLVVMAIIAILIGLTVAAVMKTLLMIPKIQTQHDISQLDEGMGSFMADYSLSYPPPSFLYIREDGQYDVTQAQDKATVIWLQTWFGRNFAAVYNPNKQSGRYDWNGNNQIDPPYTLFGQQCLVFYLGGIPSFAPDGTIGMTGFAPDTGAPPPTNSANIALLQAGHYGPATPVSINATRKGPYFSFKGSRLTRNLNVLVKGSPTTAPLPFPVYIDAWAVSASPGITPGKVPYAYFSAQGKFAAYNMTTAALGGDCGITSGIQAIGPPAPNTAAPTPSANAYYFLTNTGPYYQTQNNRYQIISAGADGLFGFNAPGTTPWIAGGAFYDPNSLIVSQTGKDDQSNFASGPIGNGQ